MIEYGKKCKIKHLTPYQIPPASFNKFSMLDIDQVTMIKLNGYSISRTTYEHVYQTVQSFFGEHVYKVIKL